MLYIRQRFLPENIQVITTHFPFHFASFLVLPPDVCTHLSTMSKSPIAPSFTPLAPQISLHTPPTHIPSHLIIICTWLGAHPKHIAKYTTTYSRFAPTARILLIESDLRSVTASYAWQRRHILPAVEVVQDVLATEKSPNIQFHTFSNGGPNSATQLLIVLRERTGKALEVHGMICDSGPAAGEYWRNYNAMVRSCPAGFARLVAAPIVHGILVLLAASIAMGRYEKPEGLIRRTLVGGEWIAGRKVEGEGGDGKGGRRILYVFSKEDKMTWWEDVTSHAELARGEGWDVEEWCVGGTDHCNHFMGNVEEYTRRMREMWEGGERSEGSTLR